MALTLVKFLIITAEHCLSSLPVDMHLMHTFFTIRGCLSACSWCMHHAFTHELLLTFHLLLPVQLCRAWHSNMQLCLCCLAHTDRLRHPLPWARKWPMWLTGWLGRDSRYSCTPSTLILRSIQLYKWSRYIVLLSG